MTSWSFFQPIALPPSLDLSLDTYDTSFRHLGPIIVDRRGSEQPFFAAGPDTVLFGGAFEASLYHRIPGGPWAEIATFDTGSHRAAWIDDRYVLTVGVSNRNGARAENFAGIAITDLVPGLDRPTTLASRIEEFAGHWLDPAYHRIHQAPEKLLLITNLVGEEPENGYVRRLRVHEIEPIPVPRRRGVHRR